MGAPLSPPTTVTVAVLARARDRLCLLFSACMDLSAERTHVVSGGSPMALALVRGKCG